MSIRALHSAASGMTANEFNLDTISNNLANAGTAAFKRSDANFEDLFYEHFKLPGTLDAGGTPTPNGIAVGLGTRVASTKVDFRNGSLLATEKEFDLAIAGEGFFQVQEPGGGTVYTRAGTFTQNADGAIVMQSADTGRMLVPNITIPQGAQDISISEQGVVSYREAGPTPGSFTLTQAGQIQLAQFTNQGGLIQVGNNLYAETDASGSPVIDIPGAQGLGVLRQGFLEASNVEPVKELVSLIKTQRNFELNSQSVQAADQMLQLIGNLRRF